MRKLEPANGLLSDPEALRRQAEEDGCLLFVQIFDHEKLLNVRRQILELCQRFGWLAEGHPMMDGVARLEATAVEPETRYVQLYQELLKLEDFHALAHDPALLSVFDALFCETTLVHPRNIARIIFPQSVKYTTPSHQDYVHIQGTPNTWTAWTPLGDCPEELGGLALLPGSHKQGIYPTHSAYGAGGLGIDTNGLGFEWHSHDFRLGDTVVFHSHLVHKGLPNLTPDRLRLSVDYRYQPVSEPVTEGSLLPHHATQTWEEVYQGWSSEPLQYYWKRYPLKIAEWSPQYHTSAKGSQSAEASS